MNIYGFEEEMLLNPKEFQEMGFQKDFTLVDGRFTVDTKTITLVNEGFRRMMRYIYDEQGRFENPPAKAVTNTGKVYNYYLDISNPVIREQAGEIEVGFVPRKGTDHFVERAKATTFEMLAYYGYIPESMKIDIPYLIQPENTQLQAVVLTIATLSLTQQLIAVAKEIAYVVADGLDVVGTGLLTAIAKAVILAAWLIATVISLIQTGAQLKELLFPKLRYLKACRDIDLIKAGLNYLGYSLQSEFLESVRQIATLPVPVGQPNKSIFQFTQNELNGYFNKGYPTAQDTTPYLWDLIDFYMKMYNLRIFAYEGVVKIDTAVHFQLTSTLVLKPSLSLQDARTSEYTFNDADTWGRSYLSWTVDNVDTHSPDNFNGIATEYISQQINTINPDLVNLKKLNEYKAPFAWMGRKNSLTRAEKFAKNFFLVIDTVISAFGGSSNLAGNIENRVGVGIISTQFFPVTKKLYLQGATGKQDANFFVRLSADEIYTAYHKSLEVQNVNRAIETFKIPLTDENAESLLQNNFATLITGEEVEVLQLSFKDELYYGTFTLKKPDNSAFNVQTVKLA